MKGYTMSEERAYLRNAESERILAEALANGARRRKVFCAMPRYGSVEREVDMAVHSAAEHRPGLGMGFDDQYLSCTPHQFNKSWTACMNQLSEWDYFLMVHSDLEPRPIVSAERIHRWLDILMEEMDAHNFDVIHACAAIKDHRGLTSTAVGSGTGPWPELRRVTLLEMKNELPDTFDAQTYLNCVGYDNWPKKDESHKTPVMLCNTGCMLVKLQPKFREFPGFRFITRILSISNKDGTSAFVGDPKGWDKDGHQVPMFWSEDWDFGQWCHEAGLKVGATKKVITNHFGRFPYTTDPQWAGGQLHDEAFWADTAAKEEIKAEVSK
jgi:hypothetical protein